MVNVYLSLRSGVLNKTSSHMCNSWLFPMFLLMDRSSTLINMASLIVPVKLCGSLPTILKLSTEMGCPVALAWTWRWWGALRCSLNISQRFLWIHQYNPHDTYTCKSLNIHSAFLCDDVSVPGSNQEVLDGIPSFEINMYSQLVIDVLETFT